MNTQTIFKQAPDCLPEEMDGDMLVYSPKLATTLHLNGPSVVVWNLCTGEHTVQEIIDAVSEVYADQADQVSSDIIEVAQDLESRGFLIKVPS